MKKQTADLIETLKDAGEDFEFYPTTKDMVRAIWDHALSDAHSNSRDRQRYCDVLDIGCGTCNFRRWIEELNREEPGILHLHKYFVIEKSTVLLERLDAETIVLGTDFHETTLIDKAVDIIFCNPPYSEYEEWTRKIITESQCKGIYLVIPERWKNSEIIKKAISTLKAPLRDSYERNAKVVEVIGHADFLNAERTARAKVDILFINKVWTKKEAGFDMMFDELFGMPDDNFDPYTTEYKEKEEREENLKNALAAGKNKVEILCEGYNAARDDLFRHFKAIAGLDAATLKSIGVHKEAVKEALKTNMRGLKALYWKAAFDCLDEITSRLTTASRDEVLNRFGVLKTVDFTPSNLYAMIIWVIKNYNKYAEKQMIDLYYGLSSKENVQNYVSNKRVFVDFRSRLGNDGERPTHYTLDYRIVCTHYALPGHSHSSSDLRGRFTDKIQDVCAVANNLGFTVEMLDMPSDFGERGTAHGKDHKLLFEFRCYRNDNVHIKFNIELMKALNVAAAQKLGWIRKPEDIKAEFPPEMANGAEQYFDRFNACAAIDVNRAAALLLPA